MIAIPSKPIVVASSNIPEGNGAYDEWSAGTFSKGDRVKVTTTGGSDYVGKVYQSLIDSNSGVPMESRDWYQIDVLEYDSGTVYSNGDTVSVLSTHGVYLSMEDSNYTSPLDADSKWQFISKTNVCSFLDYYFSTVTELVNEDLIMELTFETADHISLFGIFGADLTIEQLDVNNGDSVIQTDTVSRINTGDIVDFASYLQFTGCDAMGNYMQDLIPMVNHKVRITINQFAQGDKNMVELATVSVGKKLTVGCTLYGLKSSRIAITPPTYDKWGDVNMSGDDFVKTFTGNMFFDPEFVDNIDTLIETLFNQPATFLLTGGQHDAFNTMGLMTSSDLSLDDVNEGGIPLKIKSFKYRRQERSC